LVLNLSGEKHGVQNTDRRTLPLTQTSFLSRGTRCAAEIRTVSPANILRFSAQLGCQSPQKALAAGGRSIR
jgi:hypothetical protein